MAFLNLKGEESDTKIQGVAGGRGAPALVEYGGALCMAYAHPSGVLAYCYLRDDVASPSSVTDRPCGTPPALAVYNGRIYVARVAGTGIVVGVLDPSSTQPIEERLLEGRGTDSSPSLAAFNGRLHLVFKEAGSFDLYHAIFDGTAWHAPVRINQTSRGAPSIAAHKNQLHIVHLGGEDDTMDLWWSTYDGSTWRPDERIDQTSRTPPFLVNAGGLLLVHLGGSASATDIWISIFDGARWRADSRVPNQTSSDTPAIAEITWGKGFSARVMVHNGRDGSGYWCSFEEDSLEG